GGQVGGGRAGVDPVGGAVHGVERPVGDHGREGHPLDVDALAGRDPVEDRGLEHVGAGVDEVGRGLVAGRLLDERLAAAVRVRGDHAVGGGVVDLGEGDGVLGATGLVEGDERPDVEIGEDVAV